MNQNEEILKEILSKLDTLSEKVVSLEQEIQKINNDTTKMSHHVDFIENVWNTICRPFNKLLGTTFTPIENKSIQLINDH